MKIKILSISIIIMLALSNAIILFGIHSNAGDGQPVMASGFSMDCS